MKKKILYLSHRIPYPPNKGDKIRSFHEIRHLSKSHTIDLITLADDPDDLKYVENLKEYCRHVVVYEIRRIPSLLKGGFSLFSGASLSQKYFYHSGFQKMTDKWLVENHYDTLFCFSSPMAEYVFRSKTNVAIERIMDFCDLDSDKWNQYAQKAKFPLNWLYNLEGRRLLSYEKKINQEFEKTIFISHKESELFLKKFSEARNISIISNGVDHHYFDPIKVPFNDTFPKPMLVFSGAMDYYANVDAVCWFVDRILPDIKKKIPDIRFYIVGSNPSEKVNLLRKDPAVIVTGFVDDIREYYQAADLCIMPIRIARGVQNKVLEAMSMEKPIVSTTAAVQGIHQDVSSILKIEDRAPLFAQKILALLSDSQKKETMGKQSRQFVLKHYNWDTNLKCLLS